MRREVQTDMDLSSKLFDEQVWPLCREACGYGRLLQMEGVRDNELAKQLDTLAGIDGWQIRGKWKSDPGGMRGIAARVQVGTDWRTFTIRKQRDTGASTEYEKRVEAIDGKMGYLYPIITVHSYAVGWDGPILSVGISRTITIIRFIQDRLRRGIAKQNRTERRGAADFWVCKWAEMNRAGYPVFTVDGKTGQTCLPVYHQANVVQPP